MGMFPMPHVNAGHVIRQIKTGANPWFQGKKSWSTSQRRDMNPGAICKAGLATARIRTRASARDAPTNANQKIDAIVLPAWITDLLYIMCYAPGIYYFQKTVSLQQFSILGESSGAEVRSTFPIENNNRVRLA